MVLEIDEKVSDTKTDPSFRNYYTRRLVKDGTKRTIRIHPTSIRHNTTALTVHFNDTTFAYGTVMGSFWFECVAASTEPSTLFRRFLWFFYHERGILWLVSVRFVAFIAGFFVVV